MHRRRALVEAAVTGILASSLACEPGVVQAPPVIVPMQPAQPPPARVEKREPAPDPIVASETPTSIYEHACKGANECKGAGGCKTEQHACKGLNDCKGLGGCRTSSAREKQSCKGQNACKGQGGCKTDKNACKGQNDCKGQGGCRI